MFVSSITPWVGDGPRSSVIPLLGGLHGTLSRFASCSSAEKCRARCLQCQPVWETHGVIDVPILCVQFQVLRTGQGRRTRTATGSYLPYNRTTTKIKRYKKSKAMCAHKDCGPRPLKFSISQRGCTPTFSTSLFD